MCDEWGATLTPFTPTQASSEVYPPFGSNIPEVARGLRQGGNLPRLLDEEHYASRVGKPLIPLVSGQLPRGIQWQKGLSHHSSVSAEDGEIGV
uniref:Uncharacterized protein n=1 Tax=Timema shepardi TaxID=629360 RepID=A0A7R9ALD3_TIMSH|nr:unnamed protein product [Timema shepardi]